MSENLKFKISSALKDVIGRDLITDDFVAIFELVKNSFDAFANDVIIRFDLEKDATNKIYIIDDGTDSSISIDPTISHSFSNKNALCTFIT